MKLLLFALTLTMFSYRNDLRETHVSSTCESFKISYQLEQSGKLHTLDIVVEGGKEPIKVILTKDNGPVISDSKFEERHFTSLKPGTYFCTAIDNNNCKKNLEITIK